jgi:hypothetical protein
MSFLKKLFGIGGEKGEPGAPKVLGEETFEGYKIKAIEMKAGAEYQLAGLIEKEFDGEVKSSQFIRADRLASADMAASAAIEKGKQIVKEQGDRLFD